MATLPLALPLIGRNDLDELSHEPLIVVLAGSQGQQIATKLRLPRCRFWQWVNDGVGGPTTCNYEYGDQTQTGPFETIGTLGPAISDVHIYPGDDVVVVFTGLAGGRIWLIYTR